MVFLGPCKGTSVNEHWTSEYVRLGWEERGGNTTRPRAADDGEQRTRTAPDDDGQRTKTALDDGEQRMMESTG